jgi:hypothetical protein
VPASTYASAGIVVKARPNNVAANAEQTPNLSGMSFLSVNSSDGDAHLTDLKLLYHAVIKLFQDTFRNDWNVRYSSEGRTFIRRFAVPFMAEPPLARRAALFTL